MLHLMHSAWLPPISHATPPCAPTAPVLSVACQRISRRSSCIAAATAARTDGPVPSPGAANVDKAAVREHVNRAASMLDQMLSTIMREMFVDQAASFVTDEKPELEQCQAIRNAVAERIEVLDANFLAAINGYIAVATSRQEAGLQELLEAVRDEVLRQVALRLPPAARVMDAAMQQQDKDERLAVLRSALTLQHPQGSPQRYSVGVDDEDALPENVSAEELMTTVTQLIEDMEEQQVVADRRLLARLCLVREELRWLEAEDAFTLESDRSQSLAAKFARKNVPQRCIAFLKELLLVNDSSHRVGLLKQALHQDWEGAAPRVKQTQGAGGRSGGGSDSTPSDVVRPGRFMATLHALETQLLESMEQGVGPAAGHDMHQNERVLRRLSDVRMEAVTVLDAMQRGRAM